MIKQLQTIFAKALNDSSNYTIIPIDKKDALINLLHTKYNEAYNQLINNYILYRVDSIYDTEYFEIKPGIRRAEDSNNVYTVLISDILSGWKAFPKRNRSIIMTNDSNNADKYKKGNRIKYCILPANGAKLAICPTADMWDAFKVGDFSDDITLNIFNDALLEALGAILSNGDYKYVDTYIRDIKKYFELNDVSNILKTFNIFNNKIKNINNIEEEFKKMNLFKMSKNIIRNTKKSGNIINVLDDMLDPALNSFSLTNINNLNSHYNGLYSQAAEYWTDSECLFIDIRSVNDLKNIKI